MVTVLMAVNDAENDEEEDDGGFSVYQGTNGSIQQQYDVVTMRSEKKKKGGGKWHKLSESNVNAVGQRIDIRLQRGECLVLTGKTKVSHRACKNGGGRLYLAVDVYFTPNEGGGTKVEGWRVDRDQWSSEFQCNWITSWRSYYEWRETAKARLNWPTQMKIEEEFGPRIYK